MNGNTELLNYIYQNSQMGVRTIEQLLKIAEDKDFTNLLQIQEEEYKKLNESAVKLLNEHGHEEKEIGAMAKVSAYMSINMKTLADKSPTHIAEMLIQGSTMGIIDATKIMKEYAEADNVILELADKLLKTEQNNIEELKKFL